MAASCKVHQKETWKIQNLKGPEKVSKTPSGRRLLERNSTNQPNQSVESEIQILNSSPVPNWIWICIFFLDFR